MNEFKTLDDLAAAKAAGSVVLVRADLNVPLDETGAVRDATRLERLIPTLMQLSALGYRIGILSHFGRPKGQCVAEMSLAPVAHALGELLGKAVGFAPDCIGEAAKAALSDLDEGGICVLENTRFHAGEEADAADFAETLAAPAAAYVNDAFSAAHRAQSHCRLQPLIDSPLHAFHFTEQPMDSVCSMAGVWPDNMASAASLSSVAVTLVGSLGASSIRPL